jgi:diguanylate cyclase (GGDEF)-like protein/PAS domain S-box-containing protein
VGQTREAVLAEWTQRLLLTLLIVAGLMLFLVWMMRRLEKSEARRRTADEQNRLLASVFEHSGEALIITDADNAILNVNPTFSQLTGYEPGYAVGKNPSFLSAGSTSKEKYQEMWQSILATGGWQGEIWDRHKEGHAYPNWLTISTIRDAAGNISHYIGSFTDISTRKAAEERIHYLAHHDALTGLPNRLHLQSRLEQALASARRENKKLAVLFIDLDRFKLINDSFGHHVGDGLLVQVAERLRESVRESDVVARLGGDEFIVALTDIEQNTVNTVADKMLQYLSRPYLVAGHEVHSTPSIGVGLFPDDGQDLETVMKNADAAMYEAKAAGRNTWRFFKPATNTVATAPITSKCDELQAS